MSTFKKGILIWGIASLYYFYDNLLQVAPSAMKLELTRDFNISATDLGMLSSCYLWAYGIMQIPAGLLLDKFGPRRVLTVAAFVCACGTLLFGMAPSLLFAKVGRCFIGVGASFAIIGCSKIAANWFPPRKFAFFIGIMASIGMLGGAYGLFAVDSILEYCSNWRVTMSFAAAISFILAIAMWLIIKDKPDTTTTTSTVKKTTSISALYFSLKEVLKSNQSWLVSSYAALMFVPTLAFGALWGVPFLMEGHGLSRDLAGKLVSLIFIGFAIGCPIWGYVSDFIGLRNLPMYISSIATIIVCCLLIYIPSVAVWFIALMMLLIGMLSCGFILAFAVIRESNKNNIVATAIGFINTLNTLGGAIMQIVIGKALDYVVSGKQTAGIDPYTFVLADYKKALLIIPVCILLALVMLFFVKETRCRVNVD